MPALLNAIDSSPQDALQRTGRSRRQQQRARAAVLSGLLLFVCFQVGFRFVIEEWHPEMRDPTFENKYCQLRERIAACSQPPATVVFLGSSMTAHGMQAGLVEEPLSRKLNRPVVAYNLAANAGGPFTQLLYLQRLLRRGLRPDLVIVELSPLMYDYPDYPSDVNRFPAYLLDHDDVPTVARYSHDADLSGDWWQAFLVPIYGHRLTILTQAANVFVPFADRMLLWHDMDAHGWCRLERPTNSRNQQILDAVKKDWSTRLGNYAVGEPPLRALRELTDLLDKEHIPTAMVVMPEGPLLRSLYNLKGLACILNEFSSLARLHGFPLIDARSDLDETHFSDSFHLASTGARRLTTRVLNEAISPILSAQK